MQGNDWREESNAIHHGQERAMQETDAWDYSADNQGRLLSTLQQLLEIEATEVRTAVERASNLISRTLDVDKIDVFLQDPTNDTLIALGVSDTPMGRRQREIGLDRLPVANGGRTVESYLTGETYVSGATHQDPEVLDGIKHGLGVRSMILVPLTVNGERRGVLSAADSTEARFLEDDLHFMEAVARWLGIIIHRAELVESIAADAAERGRRSAAVELITVLAHDLGNYLTPLKGRLDLIRRRASREGRQHDIDNVDAASISVKRIRRLVDDLLDAGRLEQGLFSLSIQSVECCALLHDTASLFRAPNHDIEVHGPGELEIEADPDRLRQALENIVSNAVAHSPPGVPVTIEVREEQRGDGPCAVFSVKDRGPGIAPELIPNLFDRFMRGLQSNGLGLGLFLARGIALAHGGSLTVQSAPGDGATFILSLPVSPQLESDADPQSS
jgi:two-component system, OmpR family, sensor kinase